MKLTDKAAVLEAVLFACGDPVDVERISAATGIEKGAISQLADSLNEAYAENGSSLVVLRLSGLYQLAVRREYYEYVKLAAETKKNAPLTPAAMEVLTIIAYNQPVTKSFVEHIRGTDSSSVVNSLVEKGLLEEAAYRTTPVFLRCFGFESLDDLPPLPGRVPDEAEVSEDEPEI